MRISTYYINVKRCGREQSCSVYLSFAYDERNFTCKIYRFFLYDKKCLTIPVKISKRSYCQIRSMNTESSTHIQIFSHFRDFHVIIPHSQLEEHSCRILQREANYKRKTKYKKEKKDNWNDDRLIVQQYDMVE